MCAIGQERGLARARLEFRNPLFTGIDYFIHVDEKSIEQSTVKLYDGGRLMATATFTFQLGHEDIVEESSFLDSPCSEESAHWDAGDFLSERTDSGIYAPSSIYLRDLIIRWGLSDKGVSAVRLEEL
ncbi:MAG TPA: hypothetical protein VGW77_26340 [Candidatus Binatia bacterium]|jgi:hypothetical protein|nr:hypothetical protein [Candidatus Binatia bacterium]